MNGPIQPPELPPRYYLSNFTRLLDTVASQYGDLLAPREHAFLQMFAQASEALRCLYVRLVSRRGPLFRTGQLDYPELGDLAAALQEGVACGLLQREDSPDFAALATLLRKAELAAIYGDALVDARRLRKPELVAAVTAAFDEAALVAGWRRWRDDDDWLVAPASTEVVALLQLLFFGNGYQDLTEFVLSDLGYANYARYSLNPDYRLFSTRAEIDEYLELLQLKQIFRNTTAVGDRGTLVALGRRLRGPAAGPAVVELRNRLRLRLARQCEREGFLGEARALYQTCNLHPARQRLARLLAPTDPASAYALCEAIESDPWCEAERDFARRSLPPLAKRLGRPSASPPRDAFTQDRLCLPRQSHVEQAALRHYLQSWPEAYHLENLLFNASFGLAFWEQIFAPVPGAFVNPFQAAPLDMHSPRFLRARRTALEQRLEELAQVDLAVCLLTAYQRHQGITNVWVAWRAGLKEVLEKALRTIPRAHWLAIWRRMLFDPDANRNGFPDLLLLYPGEAYQLVEVKGPGDQLQANQRRWMRFFKTQGIPASLCRVSWRDD
ncbi:MAG: VRR-NUC domain-containing protein [Halieaceae bacterium]|jgi:hypothetical protein|nr:VRR-NUC domain-containing protein [Halieaceae bacterium]